MTSSPILITAPLPPASGSSIGESIEPEAFRARPECFELTKTGEFSNGAFGEFMSGTHSQLGSGMTGKESGVVARDQRPQATGASEHAQMKFERVARQFSQPEPPTALGLAFEMTRFNQSQPIGGSNVPLEK
jgi:hypothetical protein